MTKENLLRAINKYHPKSLTALRARLRAESYQFEDEELGQLLKQLGLEGKLILVPAGVPVQPSISFVDYLRDLRRSWWVFAVCLVGIAESALVVFNLQSSLLFGLRAVFGVLLLGFAPGYAATRAVFPGESFPLLERAVLSVFLSLVVSIGIGTLLGAFLLFDAGSSTLLIGLSTISLGLVGAYRGWSLSEASRSTI